MSQNTYAASLSTSSFDLWYSEYQTGSWTWKHNILYGSPTTEYTSVNRVRGYQWNSASITPTGNQAAIHFETNLVFNSFSDRYLNFNTQNLDNYLAISCTSTVGSPRVVSSSISYAITPWTNNQGAPSKTITFYGDVALTSITPNSSQIFTCQITPTGYGFFYTYDSSHLANMYFEQNPMTINYSNDLSETLLQQQISQNSTIISQNQQLINRQEVTTDAVNNMSTNVQNKIQAQSTQQHSDSQAEQQKLDNIANKIQSQTNAENTANNNISNQNSSDISGAENQSTTNLIGVLSNFLTQLRGFSATNCNLDLPFPQFIGGTQTVNICQGKDVLGNFITIVGTLAMVGFYIPLALLLIRMIYNEIRSFTNG